MTREEREMREFVSRFTDPKYAKKAWSQFFAQSLCGDAKVLPPRLDSKTGDIALDSAIEQMAYENVKARLKKNDIVREPMQAEIIAECGIIRARFNDTSFNIVLDRTAGKVKDEIAVSQNAYADLTDEELITLQKLRENKESEKDNENT